ncbi:MAG: endonuclease/exonuclease/phosphatase family protein [Chloroflexota bacterium]
MTQKIILGTGLTITALTFASLAGQFYWALDVLTHFTIQFALLLLLCLIAGAAARVNWRYLLVMVVGLVPNLVILYPYYLPSAPAQAAPGTDAMTLVSINVYAGNNDFEAIVDYVLENDPDLVLFTEARYEFIEHLEQSEFATAYPHVYAEPSRWTRGLMFASKTPFTSAETIYTTERSRFLSVVMDWQGQPVTFFSVHPLPPLNSRWTQSRNDVYTAYVEYVNAVETPLIMVGDFNAAPWSSPLRQLTASTGLQPGAYGHGIRPTWFYLGVIQAPLDYMLVSPEWDVVRYQTAGNVGSDHLPLVAAIRLRQNLSD